MNLTPIEGTPSSIGRLRTLALALIATVALLAGCSTGGDEADDATTTTEAEQSTTTADDTTETTGDDSDETTTTAGGSGGDVTTEDLDALMPETGDIGPDYEMTADVEEDDEPSESDAALEEQCPGAAQFMSPDDAASDAAYRLFETSDDREIEIKIDPTPNPNFEEGRIDEVIDAVNSCDTIEVEQDGFTMTLDIEATADDTYGDRGVVISMRATMNHEELLAPLELGFSARAFVVGSVSVSLSSSDGIDGQTADEVHVVPGDHDLLADIAAALEPAVADIQS